MKYDLVRLSQPVLAMPLVLWFLLAPALLVLSQPSPMPTQPPDCPKKCGDVDIPYPFGIGSGCAWSGQNEFNVTCNHSFNPPRPYTGNIEIIDISLLSGQMRVYTHVSHKCFNSSNTTLGAAWKFKLILPFLISERSNEFTAIGCGTRAFLQGMNDRNCLFGCVTRCVSLDAAAYDGEPCTGLGCCQTPYIPNNHSTIIVDWGFTKNNPAWRWSPCSYALVAEKGWYKFSRKDLNGTGGMATDRQAAERGVPLVLDWAINDGTCPPPPITSACVSANSYCVNATQGLGYLCNCFRGYEGNPYVTSGCTNINECELRKLDPKTYEERYPCQSGSTCHDTDGSYNCKCNFGRIGKSCQPITHALVDATIATFCAVVVSVVLLWFIRTVRKRRKQRGFFNKNGGQILKSMNINIFTKVQLDRITTNYSSSIGSGAFGVVYEGITEDNQRVAVKRSSAKGEERCTDDFVNEITIQFRISHTNLVRLVGCCLDTDVPMLVFELISNGSLYRVLHGTEKRSLPLQARLDIAIGSAEALSYMHTDSGHNIIHGDVKSGNILLGDNFMPKVSDFGTSKQVSVTRYASWSVTGDLNYIDPVYIKTSYFTEKSDVYSFGVVILELITRKRPKYDGSNSLPINFVKSYKEEGTRREMYDKEISSCAQPYYMECLDMIGGIAVQCLKEERDERPTMAQVVDELKLAKLRVSEAEVMGN